MNLATANRPESQEICFIPDNNYHRFLWEQARNKIKAGAIVDQNGKVLGQHQGVPFYTIGQRKGLGIAAAQPLYVLFLNARKNQVVAGQEQEVYRKKLIAAKLNIITGGKITKSFPAKAKIRSAHQMAACRVYPLGQGKARVEFAKRQWAITPGQAVVFYDKDKILGGGTIIKAD